MAYRTDDIMRDVVMTTRAALQRNFADLPFPACLDETGAQNVIDRMSRVLDGWIYEPLDGFDGDEGAYIRLLCGMQDDDLASSPLPHGIFTAGTDDERDCAAVNGRDHVRFAVSRPGWQPEETFLRITGLDDLASGEYEIAFDEKLGYLTAAPADLGTAFRMSADLFLPALEGDGRLAKVMPQLGRLGLSMRPAYGVGMSVYTLSTQTTMGQSEQESLKKLSDITTQLCGLERSARSGLLSDDPDIIADRSLRALAILRSALIIPADEYRRLWRDARSAVFYGCCDIDYSVIDSAACFCENELLGVQAEGLTDDRSHDKARAKAVRELLSAADEEENN